MKPYCSGCLRTIELIIHEELISNQDLEDNIVLDSLDNWYCNYDCYNKTRGFSE